MSDYIADRIKTRYGFLGVVIFIVSLVIVLGSWVLAFVLFPWLLPVVASAWMVWSVIGETG